MYVSHFCLLDPQHYIKMKGLKFQTIVYYKGGNGEKENGRMKRAYDPVSHSQASQEEEGLLHNSGPKTKFFNWRKNLQASLPDKDLASFSTFIYFDI